MWCRGATLQIKLLQQHNKRPHKSEDDLKEIEHAPEKCLRLFKTPNPQPQASHSISVNSESDEDIPVDLPQHCPELPQEKQQSSQYFRSKTGKIRASTATSPSPRIKDRIVPELLFDLRPVTVN